MNQTKNAKKRKKKAHQVQGKKKKTATRTITPIDHRSVICLVLKIPFKIKIWTLLEKKKKQKHSEVFVLLLFPQIKDTFVAKKNNARNINKTNISKQNKQKEGRKKTDFLSLIKFWYPYSAVQWKKKKQTALISRKNH